MTIRWAWLPRPLPFAIWLVTRLVLLSLVETLYPWEWYPDLLFEWVKTMTAGGNPYLGGQAYPPLSMLAFLFPGAFSQTPEAFRFAYALFVIAIDLALLLWMRRAERDGFGHATLAYAVALPSIGAILLLWRFDLLPMLCQVAAVVCAARGSRRWSWAWLGLGIALKLYLLALVPLWLAWEVFHGRGAALPQRAEWPGIARRAAAGLALAFTPLIISAAVALAVWGPRTLEPYTYSFGREITIDSTAGIVMAELGRQGLAEVRYIDATDCFCPVRTAGPQIDLVLRTTSSVAAIAGVLFFTFRYWLKPNAVRLVTAVAGITTVTVVASPLLSPQHLVWPLAPIALLAWSGRGRLALALAMFAAATAAYGMWGAANQVHVALYTDLGRVLLGARVLAEIGAVVALIWPTELERNDGGSPVKPAALSYGPSSAAGTTATPSGRL